MGPFSTNPRGVQPRLLTRKRLLASGFRLLASAGQKKPAGWKKDVSGGVVGPGGNMVAGAPLSVGLDPLPFPSTIPHNQVPSGGGGGRWWWGMKGRWSPTTRPIIGSPILMSQPILHNQAPSGGMGGKMAPSTPPPPRGGVGASDHKEDPAPEPAPLGSYETKKTLFVHKCRHFGCIVFWTFGKKLCASPLV